ncbi:transcription elongation factor Spt5 [Sodiomyces alkalinus F11]|uniref:Transcription elongation factor SPT5 n=1 Tax=Sodiomyces alkalinus (strain CBS 110278 / VKM F-3762 / F11) TaxID=1314773 RepID=A0A3N2PP79_SODAK|nr:transcription elongation factor Spt5 [Sodiomyces alkalinus F11]ROT36312.1 transcription elongation factor Spt5 [Sodiomyces alkalinus F11]
MTSNNYNQFEESEDEDDFNPAPADISDDENAGNERDRGFKNEARDSTPVNKAEDDEDESLVASKPSAHAAEHDDERGDGEEEEEDAERTGNAVDDEEEEEEEDDEDEDEDDVQHGHRRKRRRDRRTAFFDIEAEVDDEEDGEDEEKDVEEIEDFIDNEHPDDVVDTGRLDDRRHRELDRQRELENSMDAEKQAEILRQRYGNRRPARGLGDSSFVPKRLLMPSVDDPTIWAVRCKEGKEREVVFAIQKRVQERMGTRDELAIFSAFERGGPQSVMKGYVYVEATRTADIMAALDGMLNVYPRNKLVLVDIKDRPDLLRVTKTPTLEPGAWVRLRRPAKHAGDLAQVLDVTENGLEARVRFIPRLDYGVRDESLNSVLTADGKRKRPVGMPGPRPPQRLFNETEARKRHPRHIQGNPTTKTWTYMGDEFENGFQVKDIKIQQLVVQDVNPTLEEVTRFASGAEDGTENLDMKALAASLKDSNANVAYLPGDIVEVYEGEQRGVVGRATSVSGDIVTLEVIKGDLAGQVIEVPTKGLRKRFREGDHVKVVGGSKFRDEVGMVVKIEDDRVTFITDQTNTEVTVFSKDLREASDIGGQGSLGQYSLLDLVQLDPTTVACIVKVDRESLVVLDQHGDTRQVLPSQIANKLPKRKIAVAADRDGSEIRLDDVVREAGGQQRQGKIIHIHRSFIFLHSHSINENAGVFVTRAGNVTTVAAKGGRVSSAGPNLDQMNPAVKRNPAGVENKMLPPKTFGRDRALGQTVIIKKGGYKGLLGIVKDTTDTMARVELHTKSKTISVPKEFLSFKDKHTGARIDIGGRPPRASQGGGGGFGGAGRSDASWQGGRTPMAGSERTPAWGSRTPAVTSGARTPAWKASAPGGDYSGSRTPAWADGSRTAYGDGNRTAYGGGSRTPAWQSGARTPAPGGDAFGVGSRTPAYASDAWGSGSKTPAYGGVSAPTPAASGGDSWGYGGSSNAYDAPTPGVGLGAPTPGALNAPTPGAYSAPTPGAPTPGGWQGGWGADSAPTPAAAAAPTPAASGSAYYGAPTPAAYGAPETPAASGPRYTDDD